MAVPRTLLAAALLACGGAVALSGCTPAESHPTVAAASAAAVADEAADGLLDEDDAFLEEEEDEAYSPAAEPSATGPAAAEPSAVGPAGTGASTAGASTAGPECTAPTERPGHQVLVVVAAGPAEITAQPARYTCDPARYAPTGSPVHYGFAAAGVTATLVDRPHGDPARAVPLPELITHLDDCLAERDPADPFGCHGNAYDVVLDSHGRIMRIGELAEP